MSRLTRTLACLAAFAATLTACSYSSRAVVLPEESEIQSSTLYAADGTLMYTFHAEENRKVIPLDQIPPHVRNAVIAIEDERYYRHNGVDVRGVLRAARTNAAAGDVEETDLLGLGVGDQNNSGIWAGTPGACCSRYPGATKGM